MRSLLSSEGRQNENKPPITAIYNGNGKWEMSCVDTLPSFTFQMSVSSIRQNLETYASHQIHVNSKG